MTSSLIVDARYTEVLDVLSGGSNMAMTVLTGMFPSFLGSFFVDEIEVLDGARG